MIVKLTAALFVLLVLAQKGRAVASSLQCFVCSNCPTVETSMSHVTCNSENALRGNVSSVSMTTTELPFVPGKLQPKVTNLGGNVNEPVTTVNTPSPISESITKANQMDQADTTEESPVRSKRNIKSEGQYKCFRMQAKDGKMHIVKRGCLYSNATDEVYRDWRSKYHNDKHMHFNVCDSSFCNGGNGGHVVATSLLLLALGALWCLV